MAEEKEWFECWFDSEYYHLLYGNRDKKEAVFFIDNLLGYLHLKSGAALLDLCCGKGRHAVYLAEKGYNVTGIDVSENSIRKANSASKDNLRFIVHDMRKPMPGKNYDAVFNLFTSFGYFENEEENQSVISAVSEKLNQEGIFVLDYMNVVQAEKDLVASETKFAGDTKFLITRKIKDGFFRKNIIINDHGKYHNFTENVRNYTLNDFRKMLNATGLQIIATFGDYSLSSFDENSSPRLILIAQKAK